MKTLIRFIALFLLLTTLPSCAVVGGIFKAGMVWGILLVAGITALILFLVARSGKK